MRRVLGIGASTMAGNVSGMPPMPSPWWDQVEAHYATAAPDIVMDNRAVGGAGSQSWSPTWRWANEVEVPRLDVTLRTDSFYSAIVQLGGNDALGAGEPNIDAMNLDSNSEVAYGLAMDEIATLLSGMIPAARSSVVARWFLITPFTHPDYDTSGNENQRRFNVIVRHQQRWCRDRAAQLPQHIVLIDFDTTDPTWYTGADVHPNQAGHDAIAAAVIAATEPHWL